MMGSSITNNKYCQQGHHIVHADKMTTFNTGKVTLHLCVDCKAQKIEARAEIKRNNLTKQTIERK